MTGLFKKCAVGVELPRVFDAFMWTAVALLSVQVVLPGASRRAGPGMAASSRTLPPADAARPAHARAPTTTWWWAYWPTVFSPFTAAPAVHTSGPRSVVVVWMSIDRRLGEEVGREVDLRQQLWTSGQAWVCPAASLRNFRDLNWLI